jgi:TrmH family RNA methyltransferase
MKNHGFTDLAIVTGQSLDLDEAARLAVHATDVLDNAVIVPDLETAIESSSVVAGVTRRVGQKRKLVSFSAHQLATLPAVESGAPISVVFGNEQSGLSDEELLRCTMAVFIPTDPACPSLNLSHAVQVVAYELYVAGVRDGVRTPHRPLAVDALDRSVDTIIDSLASIGYNAQDGPQGMRALLREIFGRAALMPREATRLERLFHTLRGMYGHTD